MNKIYKINEINIEIYKINKIDQINNLIEKYLPGTSMILLAIRIAMKMTIIKINFILFQSCWSICANWPESWSWKLDFWRTQQIISRFWKSSICNKIVRSWWGFGGLVFCRSKSNHFRVQRISKCHQSKYNNIYRVWNQKLHALNFRASYRFLRNLARIFNLQSKQK